MKKVTHLGWKELNMRDVIVEWARNSIGEICSTGYDTASKNIIHFDIMGPGVIYRDIHAVGPFMDDAISGNFFTPCHQFHSVY